MTPRNSDTLALVVFVLVVPALCGLISDHRAQIMALLAEPMAPYWIAGACALALFAFVVLLVVLALRTKPSEDIYSAQDTRRPWGES